MERNAAERLVAPWEQSVRVGGIALGMSRDDVIAVCSLAGGVIAQQYAGPPGVASPSSGVSVGNDPPHLSFIECGKPGNSRAAFFAPPPSATRVQLVVRVMRDPTGSEQLGTAPDLLTDLLHTYGEPKLMASEPMRDTQSDSYAWIFPRNEQEIACVVTLPGTVSGQTLSEGIPAGGPCATHVLARIVPLGIHLGDVRISMMNPDVMAATDEAYITSLHRPDLAADGTYQAFAETARQAGHETRQGLMLRTMMTAAMEGFGAGGGGSPAGGGTGTPGSGGPDACAQCRQRCDASFESCSFGEDYSSCHSRHLNEVNSCRIGCPC